MHDMIIITLYGKQSLRW